MTTDRDHCWYCGCALVDSVIPDVFTNTRTQDHLTPRSKGGDKLENNLVYACFSCNTSKGDKTLEEYRSWLYARTPEGAVRKLAVEMLAAWPGMPAECRRNIAQVIVAVDATLPKCRFRFFGENASWIGSGDAT